LIAGGVQSSFSGTSGTFVLSPSPIIIPAPPRVLAPLPDIESTLLEQFP